MLPYTYIDTNSAEKEYNKDLKQWDVGETKNILDNRDLSHVDKEKISEMYKQYSHAEGISSSGYNSCAVGYNSLVKSFEEERKTEFSEETQYLINGLKEIRKRVMEEHDKRWKSGDVKIAEQHREALHLISELQNAMYQDVRINLKTVEILAKYLKNELFEDTKKYLTILSQLVV